MLISNRVTGLREKHNFKSVLEISKDLEVILFEGKPFTKIEEPPEYLCLLD